MGHTLAEKIIMKHIGGKDVKPGDLVVVEPDCVVVHDIYTAFLRDKMKKMGLTKVWNTDKIVIMHQPLGPVAEREPPAIFQQPERAFADIVQRAVRLVAGSGR